MILREGRSIFRRNLRIFGHCHRKNLRICIANLKIFTKKIAQPIAKKWFWLEVKSILYGIKLNSKFRLLFFHLSKFKFRYVKKYNISYFSSGISGRAIKHNVKVGSISGLTPKALTAAYFFLLETPVQIILWLSWAIEAVPKVMTATLNVVVSINSTTVMQTYWTAPFYFTQRKRNNRKTFLFALPACLTLKILFAIPASPR